jgi:hypothetical protein
VEYPAVKIHIGTFNDLGREEIVLHKLHVRAFMLGGHIFGYIDVLDYDLKRRIGIGDGCANKSVCTTNLKDVSQFPLGTRLTRILG